MATPLLSESDTQGMNGRLLLIEESKSESDASAKVLQDSLKKAITLTSARPAEGRRQVFQRRPLSPSKRELQSSDCLVDEDGNFGTEEMGERVSIYFFYQVETIPGITETMMNSVVLNDIEITLVDFLIPRLIDECSLSMDRQQATSGSNGSTNGRYVGMSANPSDFVLRGCK